MAYKSKKPSYRGMVELFTTPRAKEASFVKSVLRKHGISFRSREENRTWGGWRICIYVPRNGYGRTATIVENALDEEDNRQSPEGCGARW